MRFLIDNALSLEVAELLTVAGYDAVHVRDLILQSDLLAIADRHGAQVEVDGVIYQRHEPGTVRYYTLFGALDFERWTYREIGVRNGPTIVPLELAAGLLEHTAPARGVRIALGYANDHMCSAEEDMQADHRCSPSRRTSGTGFVMQRTFFQEAPTSRTCPGCRSCRSCNVLRMLSTSGFR